MPAEARPRRSVLYMPGSKERALEKARTLPVDAVILDLEDAVAPSEKQAARELVRKAGKAGAYGPREVIIRINGLDTEWGAADLVAASEAGPDAILIPKAESAEQIAEVDSRMTYHNAPVDTAIWAMIETPLGALKAQEIAAAPRMAAFVLGTNDLVKDLRAEHTPDRQPVMTALGLALLAARAYGLACIDGVHNALRDEEGLRAVCRQARAMGFDGKTLIHPAQIAAANEIFGPDAAAVEKARETVAAFDAAAARGEGVAVLDGRIVENLHVEQAKRLLAEAEAIAGLESAA
jgi:citrate lyase beta subunit